MATDNGWCSKCFRWFIGFKMLVVGLLLLIGIIALMSSTVYEARLRGSVVVKATLWKVTTTSNELSLGTLENCAKVSTALIVAAAWSVALLLLCVGYFCVYGFKVFKTREAMAFKTFALLVGLNWVLSVLSLALPIAIFVAEAKTGACVASFEEVDRDSVKMSATEITALLFICLLLHMIFLVIWSVLICLRDGGDVVEAFEIVGPRHVRLADGPTLLVFHETSEHFARLILKDPCGFRRGSPTCAVGAGIYFAICPSDAKRKATSHGAMLCADVELGRSLTVDNTKRKYTFTELDDLGYDSIRLTCFEGDEMVVFNYDQVRNIRRYN